MTLDSASTDPRLHETAVRIAVRCRRIVRVCLREEEWVEADREFYMVVRQELESYRAAASPPHHGEHRHG